jgi:hypothetical protein
MSKQSDEQILLKTTHFCDSCLVSFMIQPIYSKRLPHTVSKHTLTCRGYTWRIIAGSGLDVWIYWHLRCTISLNYNQYSAIADLITSHITRTCYPFPGNGFITQKLSLQITMKSSCHFFFNHLGLPILQNSIQISNSSLRGFCSVLIQSQLQNTFLLYWRGMDHIENTSFCCQNCCRGMLQLSCLAMGTLLLRICCRESVYRAVAW